MTRSPTTWGSRGHSFAGGHWFVDTKELRRAYATLGLDERASLADARIAYLTWVTLVSDPPAAPADGESDESVDAPIDLIHHELDLAWHAIEEAHELGVLFPRQSRGCQRCGTNPAVRVSPHRVAPGRVRRRVVSDSSVLCRACGMKAVRNARRECLRSGWWGLLAPFANLRALTRNSTELAFLRRMPQAEPKSAAQGGIARDQPGAGPGRAPDGRLGRRTDRRDARGGDRDPARFGQRPRARSDHCGGRPRHDDRQVQGLSPIDVTLRQIS